MHIVLQDILTALTVTSCKECSEFDEQVKRVKIKHAMEQILSLVVKECVPVLKPHTFTIHNKIEKIAHIGGYNNCRTLMIRRIRRQCKYEEEAKQPEQVC